MDKDDFEPQWPQRPESEKRDEDSNSDRQCDSRARHARAIQLDFAQPRCWHAGRQRPESNPSDPPGGRHVALRAARYQEAKGRSRPPG